MVSFLFIIVSIIMTIIIKLYRVDKKQYLLFANLIIIIPCILFIFINFFSNDNIIAYYDEGTMINVPKDLDQEKQIIDLNEGGIVEQSFISNYPMMTNIYIYILSHKRTSGNINVQLIDFDTEKVVQEWEIKILSIKDNDYLQLPINIIRSKDSLKNRKYYLKIRMMDDDPNASIQMFSICDEQGYNDGYLVLGNEIQEDRDLVFMVTGYISIRKLVSVEVRLLIELMVIEMIVINYNVRKRYDKQS